VSPIGSSSGLPTWPRLPFADDTVDLVVANVSIQNIEDRARRRTVIDEILRVTKPGGRVRIAGIQYTRQFRDDLEVNGGTDATSRDPGVRGWFGNPFSATRLDYATRLISATKPS
jgi:arsenite methyltransferase